MIVSFLDSEAKAFFQKGTKPKSGWQGLTSVAKRKLDMLHAASTLNDLKAPPNNKLEALSRDRAGRHSIRVNDQFRVCFVWTDAWPTNVEIVDYH